MEDAGRRALAAADPFVSELSARKTCTLTIVQRGEPTS